MAGERGTNQKAAGEGYSERLVTPIELRSYCSFLCLYIPHSFRLYSRWGIPHLKHQSGYLLSCTASHIYLCHCKILNKKKNPSRLLFCRKCSLEVDSRH